MADDIIGLGMLWQRDHNAIRPDDTRLFACDLGNCVAKILLMIERDIGDH